MPTSGGIAIPEHVVDTRVITTTAPTSTSVQDIDGADIDMGDVTAALVDIIGVEPFGRACAAGGGRGFTVVVVAAADDGLRFFTIARASSDFRSAMNTIRSGGP